MNKKTRDLMIAAVTLLAPKWNTACSSTTQTNVIAQGGDGGIAGSAAATGGTAGAAGSSADATGGAAGTGFGGAGGQGGGSSTGSAGSSNCSAALVPDLHAACIEDLGQNVLRIHYDFATTDQGLDWSPSSGATVSVNQKALIVTEMDTIGVAIFKKKLHVNKASYSVTLLSGYTTNWYINTVWNGSWNPDAGYGGYHDNTGRGFIINGTKYAPDDVSPVSVGAMNAVTVEQTDSELRWDQNGTTMAEAVSPLPVTDRVFALGAWMSSAAFYDVVFEGTLN